MRWGVHWRISRDSLHGRKSLFYQLGSILPDWFERHPIHRRKESLIPFLMRAERVRNMKPGLRRDWELGCLVHLLGDYCCMAHNEEYYRYYRHRIYEVVSQRYYKRVREANKPKYTELQQHFAAYVRREFPTLWDRTAKGGAFRDELRRLIDTTVASLHGKIAALQHEQWWADLRVAELDVRYSYRLIYAVLYILGEKQDEREDVS